MVFNQKVQVKSAKQQQGATMLGMLFVGVMLFFVALIVMKLFPAYQEYFSVKSVLHAMKQEPLSTMSNKEIQNSFDKRADAGYIKVIKGADLTINGGVVSAQYQVVTPLFGNLSMQMDFDASSDK